MTLRDDLQAVAEVAREGDSCGVLVRRLEGRRTAAGGVFHRMKVWRVARRMRRALGERPTCSGETRVGDVVVRWRRRHG
jgi:hypothetical protein